MCFRLSVAGIALAGVLLSGCSEPDQPSTGTAPKEKPASQEAPQAANVTKESLIGIFKARVAEGPGMTAQEAATQTDMLNTGGGKSLELAADQKFEAQLSGLKIAGHWSLAGSKLTLTPESVGGVAIRDLAKNGPSRAVDSALQALRPFVEMTVVSEKRLQPIAPSNDASKGQEHTDNIVFERAN